MRQSDMAIPGCTKCLVPKDSGECGQSQSQADQDYNKEENHKKAKQLLENNVPTTYWDIKEALGYSKTNKTVREIYCEMTLLDGDHEDPSVYNARWMREETYKDNVKSAIDLLYSYQGGAYHYVNNGPSTFEYGDIKSFIGVPKTNNTVRAIAAILQELRQNPWDEESRSYPLNEFTYYLIALRVIPQPSLSGFVRVKQFKTKNAYKAL